MKRPEMLELYSDYLLSVSGIASATGLAAITGNEISHDAITNFLSYNDYGSKELWLEVKPFVRKVENSNGVLIVDDTIQEKPYTDENNIVCWHYDHSKGRNLKGINLLSIVANYDGIVFPVAYEIVKKTKNI